MKHFWVATNRNFDLKCVNCDCISIRSEDSPRVYISRHSDEATDSIPPCASPLQALTVKIQELINHPEK